MITKKISVKIIALIIFIFIYMAFSLVYSKMNLFSKNVEAEQKQSSNDFSNKLNNDLEASGEIIDKVVYDNTVGKIVWDGLTMGELTDKLNRTLNSTLSGKGEIFATHSLELGMDPYLAVAIVMEETGCKWECSYLVKACNNVGGQKGSPGCNCGSYKAYNSLDEGIIGYLDNLYYNYYAYGLTTAELMNPKYAENIKWATNVNAYIEKIKAA